MRDFELEVYFGKHEFSAPYSLAQSDCETLSIESLLEMEGGAAEAFQALRLGYSEVTGDPTLRALIASLYETMTPERILTHAGAEEAIFAFMQTEVKRGDHLIYMSPTYQSLYSIAQDLGATISPWPLRIRDGEWTIDLDELAALIRPETSLIVLNTPNNPTGYQFTREEMVRISEIAAKQDIHVFSDEVYKGLEREGEARPWSSDLYEKAISLGVMSKAYGLAGLRIGWVATKDMTVLDKMTRFKHYLSICNTVPGEFLAMIALKNGDAILKRNRSIIEKNVSEANRFFERHQDLFENHPPASGPIAFHRLLLPMSSAKFCQRAVDQAGVLLLPGSVFDVKEPYIRMGYGRASFSENLAQLDNWLITSRFGKEMEPDG